MLAGSEACDLPLLQHLHASVQAKKTWRNLAARSEEDLPRVQSTIEAATEQQSRLFASQPHNRLSSNTAYCCSKLVCLASGLCVLLQLSD